jgi:hypothetical protein
MDMKKRMILALAGCMPLVATADIMGQNIGFADASTVMLVVLGSVALMVARRLQKG